MLRRDADDGQLPLDDGGFDRLRNAGSGCARGAREVQRAVEQMFVRCARPEAAGERAGALRAGDGTVGAEGDLRCRGGRRRPCADYVADGERRVVGRVVGTVEIEDRLRRRRRNGGRRGEHVLIRKRAGYGATRKARRMSSTPRPRRPTRFRQWPNVPCVSQLSDLPEV